MEMSPKSPLMPKTQTGQKRECCAEVKGSNKKKIS